MNRRDIFKLMGLSPVVIPAVVYAQSKEGGEPLKETVALTLYGKKQEPIKKVANILDGGYLFYEEQSYDPNKRVDIATGNDGRLWIRTSDNQWKRVVTE